MLSVSRMLLSVRK